MKFSVGLVIHNDPSNWMELTFDLDIAESVIHSDPYEGGNQTAGVLENEIMTNPADFIDMVKVYLEDKFTVLGSTTITSASITHPSTEVDYQVP